MEVPHVAATSSTLGSYGNGGLREFLWLDCQLSGLATYQFMVNGVHDVQN